MLFAVQTSSRHHPPFVRREQSERKDVPTQIVEEISEKEIENPRTSEYALLLGVVFVAAIVTMAIIGPQVAHLMAVSVGS